MPCGRRFMRAWPERGAVNFENHTCRLVEKRLLSPALSSPAQRRGGRGPAIPRSHAQAAIPGIVKLHEASASWTVSFWTDGANAVAHPFRKMDIASKPVDVIRTLVLG